MTWADEAVRMYNEGELDPLTAADVHALIDLVDEDSGLRQKLEGLERKAQRAELRILAAQLVRTRRPGRPSAARRTDAGLSRLPLPRRGSRRKPAALPKR